MRLSTSVRAPIPLWVEVVGVMIGVPWALFFAWMLYLEISDKTRGHVEHITVLCLMFLLGASIALGRWFIFPVIQVFISFYGDYRAGGRRKGDPPASPKPPETPQ